MIINVKGTKQTQSEPESAKKYMLSDMDRKTQTPFAVGMILMSFVLYLKSFLTGSDPEMQAAREKSGEESQGDADPIAGQMGAEIIELPVQQLQGSAGQVVEQVPMLTDEFSPAIFYESAFGPAAYELDPVSLSQTKPLIVSALVANDNDHFPATSGGPDTSGPGLPPNPNPAEGGPPEGPSDPDDLGQDDDDQEEAGQDKEEEEEDRVNRTPRSGGPVTLWDLSGSAPFLIGLSDLLGNASDPDGDALTIQNVSASHGTMTWKSDHWEFQSEPNFQGLVVVKYQITDGTEAVDQVAYIQVQHPKNEGTNGDDNLVGTDWAENFHGLAGDDNIDAQGGNDIIWGGDGDDHIVAGDGDDIVFGGNGNDMILGGDGDDHLYGEAGNDYLSGEEGDDIVMGGDGDDHLLGGGGADFLDGGNGNDHLDGGTGNDTLRGGAGSDIVLGGAGDDLVIASADAADDHYDGGEGFDTLDYGDSSQGIMIDLVEGVASGGDIGTDTFTGFETVVGGTGNDHFVAGEGEFTLAGGGGDDVFEFVAPTQPAGADETPAPTSAYTILDFNVGDRLRMSKYDIFERVLDRYEDKFEEIYGDDFDDDDIPIRYRHDNIDQLNKTVIEVEFNNDGIWETVVMIEGTRALVIIEQA